MDYPQIIMAALVSYNVIISLKSRSIESMLGGIIGAGGNVWLLHWGGFW